MPYADKEKQKEYWRNYQRSDKHKAYKREWMEKNPEKRALYSRRQHARYKADPDKYRNYFRNHHILKTYGITTERYEQMFRDQGGVCEVCGGAPDIHRHGISRLAIDHDHETGKVRGLLCNNCNAGMGLIGDTEQHLEAALAYLVRHRRA